MIINIKISENDVYFVEYPYDKKKCALVSYVIKNKLKKNLYYIENKECYSI